MLNEVSNDKKETIFKIAASVFAKYGYTRATMDDIAKVMGMKKNSLYYYFPSKEAIFGEVVKRECETCIAQILEDIETEKSAPEKIKKFISSGLQYRRKKLNLDAIKIEVIFDLKSTIENFYQKFLNREVVLLANIIDEGIKNKKFKKINSKEVSESILTLVNAIEFNDFYKNKDDLNGRKDFSSTDKKMSLLLDLIIEGLKIK